MGTVVLLSLTSALNPTLIAATTVMLLLPHPERLMLGYLAGALMTSITLGLVILFALPDSSTSNTTQHTLSPVADLALGALQLVVAFVLATDRDERLRTRRRERHAAKENGPPTPPRWQRALSKGSPRVTFLIGAALTLPGASYLAGLDALHRLNYSKTVDVLVVLGFNLVMLVLIEGPLVCFAVAPDWTPGAIERAKAAVGRHWRSTAVKGLTLIGALLIIKGIVGLVVR